MARPVIFTVDDDPEVLGAIERDLRQHYRGDYRILKATSGREALAAAEELKRRGSAVGLFLVDERMPGMSGTEFLAEVVKLFPDSKRVLLTAYADTEAAIRGSTTSASTTTCSSPGIRPRTSSTRSSTRFLRTGPPTPGRPSTASASPAPAGRHRATRSRTSSPRTRSPTSGSTSRRTPPSAS